MKTVKSANELIKGKEYSRDCIEILIYEGKSKFFDGKYRFIKLNYETDPKTDEDILASQTPIYLDEQQIKKLFFYD